MVSRIGTILLVCLILGVTLWGYYETLDDFFIMDDFCMIGGHSTFAQFWQHWTAPVGGNAYRPLIDLLFIWDFHWWGWNPVGWHLSNLLFHLFNVVLVMKLGQKLSSSRYAGLVAGVLFGLHPANSEAVIWISARMDVVCTTGVLLSLYFFVLSSKARDYPHPQERKRRRAYILSLVFFAGALLIKESAVTLPIFIILYDLNFATRWKNLSRVIRQKIRLYLPYMLVFGGYFIIRALVVATAHQYDSKARGLVGGYDTPIFGTFVFGNLEWYFKNLMKPFWAELFSPLLLINFTSIGLVTLCCLLLSKTSRFAVLWIWVALLPVCFLRIHRGVYLAVVGFCLLLGFLFTRLPAAFSSTSSRFHQKPWRIALRTLQVLLILALAFRYGIARKEENVWWSQVAEINEKVPLMVKTLRPTFPKGARICIHNISLVFNQRFNDAFHFRYPETELGGVYVEDFEDCADDVAPAAIASDYYFFHYRDGVLHDFTYETRERLTSAHRIDIHKFPRRPEYDLSAHTPHLDLELDAAGPCTAIGLVTALAHGSDVPQGTIVAHGQLEGRYGELVPFDIIAGQDTAEWAIRFPEVQKHVQHAMPQPYRIWTVRQPNGTFAAGQNYMKYIEFDAPLIPTRLILDMRPLDGISPKLTLDIDRLILYTLASESWVVVKW
jgi:hypothetical protein